MFALTLQKDTYVSLIEQKLGIVSSGYTDAMVNSTEKGSAGCAGKQYANWNIFKI